MSFRAAVLICLPGPGPGKLWRSITRLRLPDPAMYYGISAHPLVSLHAMPERNPGRFQRGPAADLRLEIHELVLAGKSDEQIRDYLVARYGDSFVQAALQRAHRLAGGARSLIARAGWASLRTASALAPSDHDEDHPAPFPRHERVHHLRGGVRADRRDILVVWPLLRKRRDSTFSRIRGRPRSAR